MGPTPIANHHTEERWVAMLGTHPRRQASTCQACLLAVPLSLSPNSLYYVSKGYMFPFPLSYAMCSFFVFGSGATTKDMMHQWGPCAHEEEVWKT
uniref:Uncharacterized protein n=1 Tax=Oryza glumipatula TaxID=40148 RepID=A0A0D9Z8C8_9ORYZ